MADPGLDRAFPSRNRGTDRRIFTQGRRRRCGHSRPRAYGRGGVNLISQPSVFWWQKYGTLAQMAQATVALLGFVAILLQINEIRTNNRGSSARQAFLGYSELAFQNPKFSQPDYDTIKAGSSEDPAHYESV